MPDSSDRIQELRNRARWAMVAVVVGLGTAAGIVAGMSWPLGPSQVALVTFSALVASLTVGVGGNALSRRRQAIDPSAEFSRASIRVGYVAADEAWAEWTVRMLADTQQIDVAAYPLTGEGLELTPVTSESPFAIFICSSATELLDEAETAEAVRWIESAAAPERTRLLVVAAGVSAKAFGKLPRVTIAGLRESVARRAVLGQLDDGRVTLATASGVGSPSVAKAWYPTDGPEIKKFPYDRNPDFRGRAEILRCIYHTFVGRAGGGVRACTLWGMGGVGKTNIANEYVHRHLHRYRLLWWISAELASTVRESLVELAGRLGLLEETDTERLLDNLWQQLGRRSDWLIVFDNVGEESDLAGHLPADLSSGHILITSQLSEQDRVLPQTRQILVEAFGTDEAAEYLVARTASTDRGSASAIADMLGRLPLALEQAATYVIGARSSLGDYLEQLSESPTRMIGTAAPRDHAEPVTTTLAISLDAAARRAAGARDLLRLTAILAPDQFPRTLITRHAATLPEPLASVAADRVRYDDAVRALVHYSLVTAQPDRIDVHRLVQLIVRQQMGADGERTWLDAAAAVLSAAFPVNVETPVGWDACSQLVPHVVTIAAHEQRLSQLSPAPDATREAIAVLLFRAGRYHLARGAYRDAAQRLQDCIALRTLLFGPHAVPVADTLIKYAELLYRQAWLPDCLEAAMKAYEIHHIGPKVSPGQVIEDLLWLCRVELELTHIDAALAHVDQAHGIVAESFDPEGLQAAEVDQQRGAVLWRAGRLRESLDALHHALHIKETLPDLPPSRLAVSMKNVGMLQREIALVAGDHDQLRSALELTAQAVRTVETADGKDQPELPGLQADWATVLFDLGETDRSLAILEPALDRCLALYTEEHPNTAQVKLRLATALARFGELARAEELGLQAEAVYRERYGRHHPYVAEALQVLGPIRRSAGDPLGARRALEHARTLVLVAYGNGHPKLIELLTELAVVRDLLGEPGVDDLRQQAASIREEVLSSHVGDRGE